MEITVEQFLNEWDGKRYYEMIDVRDPRELQTDGKISGTVDIPMTLISNNLSNFDKDTAYVIMCAWGGRSIQVTHYLRLSGFDKVVSLAGGFHTLKLAAPHMVE
jgi:rhodanese-related sulfurtransferase